MSPGMVVVDNHGIGYQMMVPMRGESFPKIGQEIKIYTHMHVREDDVSLFGFLSKEEKEAFDDVYNEFVASLSSRLNTDLWDGIELTTDGSIQTNSFFAVFEKYCGEI